MVTKLGGKTKRSAASALNSWTRNKETGQQQEFWWKGQRWTTGAEAGILWQGQIWSAEQVGQYQGDHATAKAVADARAEEQIAVKFGYKAEAQKVARQDAEEKALALEAQDNTCSKDKGGKGQQGQEPSKKPRVQEEADQPPGKTATQVEGVEQL